MINTILITYQKKKKKQWLQWLDGFDDWPKCSLSLSLFLVCSLGSNSAQIGGCDSWHGRH